MSNRSQKSKRQRSNANTQHKAHDITFDVEVIVTPEESDQGANSQYDQRTVNRKILMFFGKFLKRSGPADWLLAIFTAILAGTGYYQSKILDNQLSTQRIEQRAWVKVNLGASEPQKAVDVAKGRPLNVHIGVKNIGITAAKQIYVEICTELLEAGKSIKRSTRCSIRPHHQTEIGILFPKEWGSFQSLDNQSVSPADNEVDGFRLGREYIAVFGRAHYFDVFGNAHWTQYCFPIGQNGFLEDEACTNFSEEGDGDYNRQ